MGRKIQGGREEKGEGEGVSVSAAGGDRQKGRQTHIKIKKKSEIPTGLASDSGLEAETASGP